ncbi:MAG: DUF349 domain-containing protein [Microscillaceae bacterium]|nr:DUF349 domain-containing protein [Microscillaceae bacterium]MDW8460021.1 DUF349 domain-containing protein [Cytophagales bacterium]
MLNEKEDISLENTLASNFENTTPLVTPSVDIQLDSASKLPEQSEENKTTPTPEATLSETISSEVSPQSEKSDTSDISNLASELQKPTAEVSLETKPTSDAETERKNVEKVASSETTAQDIDYSTYTKAELLKAITELSQQKNIKATHAQIKKMRLAFEVIINTERALAFEAHLKAGGDAADFQYNPQDEERDTFFKLYKQVQAAKAKQIAQLREERAANTKAKFELLDQFRKLIEQEDNQNLFNEFRILQKQWNSIGKVEPDKALELKENYKALIKQFYDKQSIYAELRDLDMKRNLDKKLHICERAEQLVQEPSIKKAIAELNKLHEEFKATGPVPKGEQKKIWQRLKNASDAIYQRKREYIAERERIIAEALEKKKNLLEKIQPYKDFNTDKLTVWNEKTRELIEIQKEWDAIPRISKSKAGELNKEFWAIFKQFFNTKNAFLRALDKQRANNYKLKLALCEQAEALIADEQADSKEVAEKLKQLQIEWKKIGPAPVKQQEIIYERFKKACDSFFEKRRNQIISSEKQYELNLKAKQELCKKIDATNIESAEQVTIFDEFINEWKSIGFVPKKNMKEILQRFEIAMYRLIERAKGLSNSEKKQMRFDLQLKLSESGIDKDFSKKAGQKESILKRKIAKLENDIATLKNNLGFLQNSKSSSAEKLRQDMNAKIAESENELALLKNQLKLLQSKLGEKTEKKV